jgi:hypothetical protein
MFEVSHAAGIENNFFHRHRLLLRRLGRGGRGTMHLPHCGETGKPDAGHGCCEYGCCKSIPHDVILFAFLNSESRQRFCRSFDVPEVEKF